MKKQSLKVDIGYFKLDTETKNLILSTLERGRLSPGPITAEFEQAFARHHQRKYGVFMNSGTSALQIALHTLKSVHKWKDGDEVLVPSVTFVATVNIVIQNGMKPVFVDVDPATYNIDAGQIERHITKRTRCIIPVHLFGMASDMDPILAIARKHKLKIIEDTCESMGVRYKGRMVGSFGEIACFSTYMAHLLVTGVGGLACADREEYAIKIKSLMNHGRDSIYLRIDDDDKKSGKALFNIVQKRFSFVDVGYSYRGTELEAAIGLVGLKHLSEQIQQRQKNARYLINGLRPLSHLIRLPYVPPDREHAFMMFPITILNPRQASRDELTFYLEERGIETRNGLPLLNQPVYKKLFGDIEKKYPVGRHINHNTFYIGCHHGLTQNHFDYTIETFFDFYRKKRLV